MCYYLSMNFLRKIKHIFIPSEHNVYRPHLLRKPFLIFLLTVVLTTESVFVIDLLARQSAFNFLTAVLSSQIISYTNDERTQYAEPVLTESPQLDAAAQAKAQDMAAKGYFSHTGPDGKEPWAWIDEVGYSYSYAGENLAVRFTDSRDVVNAWMASPAHKANIIKPAYTQIGVGVAQGDFQGRQATYVVQYFGTPKDASVAVTGGVPEAAAPALAASSSGQVAGAETQPQPAASAQEPSALSAATAPQVPQDHTPWASFARQLANDQVSSSPVVPWILAGVAALLLIGLALAFFIHMQVQATEMLMGGAVVAVIALTFVALNVHTPFSNVETRQAAAVWGAMPSTGGFIDSNPASVNQ